MHDAVVVGAGVAGVAAARELADSGLSVVVLEKSRGLGGRAATRRIDGRPVDYGAQFFTARSQEFQEMVQTWLSEGVCIEWGKGFLRMINGRIAASAEGHPRYACPEGMTALAKQGASGLDIRRECHVVTVEAVGDGFLLTDNHGASFEAKAVLSTAPAPQSLLLLKAICTADAREALSSLRYAPCFSAVFEVPGFSPEWSALQIEGEDIAWVAADDSRRAARLDSHLFVIHASARFSTEHLEEEPLTVAEALRLAAARLVAPELSSAKVMHAHRWRFARVQNPLDETHIALDTDKRVLFSGDAFGHANIESAWLSGRAAAAVLRERLT